MKKERETEGEGEREKERGKQRKKYTVQTATLKIQTQTGIPNETIKGRDELEIQDYIYTEMVSVIHNSLGLSPFFPALLPYSLIPYSFLPHIHRNLYV